MTDETLRLLILGAHPDDAEVHCGGLAAIYCQLGYTVKMISVTDGGAGHHQHSREELVKIRRAEAAASGRTIGADYLTWDNPDGLLQATLDVRGQIIREIRTFAPDLVLTHRTNDYHPDHRAVGQAVQDASFMVTVPLVIPEVAALRKDPVVAYMPDRFTKPWTLQADVVVDITEQIDAVVAMLACHHSQVFQWLPYLHGMVDEMPDDQQERLAWLKSWYTGRIRDTTDRYRDALIATYGQERGSAIEYAEVYEISEYAAPLDEAARKRLFGFLP